MSGFPQCGSATLASSLRHPHADNHPEKDPRRGRSNDMRPTDSCTDGPIHARTPSCVIRQTRNDPQANRGVANRLILFDFVTGTRYGQRIVANRDGTTQIL